MQWYNRKSFERHKIRLIRLKGIELFAKNFTSQNIFERNFVTVGLNPMMYPTYFKIICLVVRVICSLRSFFFLDHLVFRFLSFIICIIQVWCLFRLSWHWFDLVFLLFFSVPFDGWLLMTGCNTQNAFQIDIVLSDIYNGVIFFRILVDSTSIRKSALRVFSVIQ